MIIIESNASAFPHNVVDLPSIIGKGYGEFWKFRGRYIACKGSRGSKKSCTAAIKYVYNMMRYSESNVLVIRRYFNTHKDSTYAQLKWAVHRLGVDHLWKFPKGEMKATYIPTGQQILFRGLDDPMSITSITVATGHLCWVWWEEAYQCTNENDFNKVDLSIRGKLPAHLWYQHTLTFNPWSDKIWLKKRFFDANNKNTLAMTTNYLCNEFLDDSDIELFEDMKENAPTRYKIEGLGDWGISEGLIFNNWLEVDFDIERLRAMVDEYDEPIYLELRGLDFGYTNDPTAFIALLASEKRKEIFIYDEMYKRRLKNGDIYRNLFYMGYSKDRISADSAAPKDIDELSDFGLYGIYGCPKPRGSINSGIQKLQDYKIYVHPKCVNTIIELSNYIWAVDKNNGSTTNDPIDEYNHLMDALRYATFELGSNSFSWM